MDLKALQVTLRGFAAELLRLADRAEIAIEAAPDSRTHVLIDWENVQPGEDDVRNLVPAATDLWLFHGPNQKNVTSRHLVVLANDKGYGPMLEHAKELGFAVEQVGFGAAQLPAKTSPRKVATKNAAAAPTPGKKAVVKKAARKTPAKKLPAKTAATKKASSKPAVKTSGSLPLSAAGRPTSARKSLEEVVAILMKSPAASRPRKLARLLAHIASMIGVDANAPEAATMLNQIIASGAVSVNDKESVTFMF